VRVQLHNKTKYRDDDLIALYRAACRAEGFDPSYGVLVVVNSRSRVSGRATVPGNWIKMCIPSIDTLMKVPWMKKLAEIAEVKLPLTAMPAVMVKQLAKVLVHEIGHNMGLEHKEMIQHNKINVDWCEGMKLRVKPSAPKKSRKERMEEIVARREANARKKLEQYASRLERDKKLVAKWKRKVAYYERRKRKAAGGADENRS
jgi:hypothetical protein